MSASPKADRPKPDGGRAPDDPQRALLAHALEVIASQHAVVEGDPACALCALRRELEQALEGDGA